MNDVLTKMLADHYGTQHVPSSLHGRKIGANPIISLRLPRPLYDAIDLDATASGETKRDRIVRVWCAKLRVEFQPGGRWANR